MIATLILIGVTAAMGSFIYWYATSYAKSSSKIFALTITELKMSKTTKGSTSFLISLRNQGTIVLELKSIIIRDDDNQVDILINEYIESKRTLVSPPPTDDRRIILNPGASVTVVYFGPMNVTLGRTYTVIVMTDQGAQQASVECAPS